MMYGHQQDDVMEFTMLPQARDWFPDENHVFMHGEAPCYTAKPVSEVRSAHKRPRAQAYKNFKGVFGVI